MQPTLLTFFLLALAIFSAGYWYVLYKQSDEKLDTNTHKNEKKIEPDIERSFTAPREDNNDAYDNHRAYDLFDNVDKEDVDEYVESVLDANGFDNREIAEERYMNDNENINLNVNDEYKDEYRDEYKNEQAYEHKYEPKVEKQGFFALLKNSLFKRDTVEEDPEKVLQSLHLSKKSAVSRPSAVRTVALVLKAPTDQPYYGQEILEVAQDLKLMIGPDGFLEHYTTTHFGDEALYSIAHLLNPGSFKDPEILDKELPGILFFANIPGPDPEIDTIEHLVRAAAYFGRELGGTLLNEHKEPVDKEYLATLCEEVRELDQKEWLKAING